MDTQKLKGVVWGTLCVKENCGQKRMHRMTEENRRETLISTDSFHPTYVYATIVMLVLGIQNGSWVSQDPFGLF